MARINESNHGANCYTHAADASFAPHDFRVPNDVVKVGHSFIVSRGNDGMDSG